MWGWHLAYRSTRWSDLPSAASWSWRSVLNHLPGVASACHHLGVLDVSPSIEGGVCIPPAGTILESLVAPLVLVRFDMFVALMLWNNFLCYALREGGKWITKKNVFVLRWGMWSPVASEERLPSFAFSEDDVEQSRTVSRHGHASLCTTNIADSIVKSLDEICNVYLLMLKSWLIINITVIGHLFIYFLFIKRQATRWPFKKLIANASNGYPMKE